MRTWRGMGTRRGLGTRRAGAAGAPGGGRRGMGGPGGTSHTWLDEGRLVLTRDASSNQVRGGGGSPAAESPAEGRGDVSEQTRGLARRGAAAVTRGAALLCAMRGRLTLRGRRLTHGNAQGHRGAD